MDRRTFLALLPAAGMPAAQYGVARAPEKSYYRDKVHSTLMREYHSSLRAPVLDIPPPMIAVPSGRWRVKWTGNKDIPGSIDLASQWFGGLVDGGEGVASHRESGNLVYVSNPGYGGVLKREQSMNITAHSQIPWATSLSSEAELAHVQGFMLDVFLDMIWFHNWSLEENCHNHNNLNAAWPKLRPKTKFYLSPEEYDRADQDGTRPERKAIKSAAMKFGFIYATPRVD